MLNKTGINDPSVDEETWRSRLLCSRLIHKTSFANIAKHDVKDV
jgi:hypothetical protein